MGWLERPNWERTYLYDMNFGDVNLCGANSGEKGCEVMNSSESVIKSAVRSNTKKVLHALGATLGMLLLCVSAFSQGSNGRIVGTVTDANGGAVTGATVTILDVQRGTSRPLSV